MTIYPGSLYGNSSWICIGLYNFDRIGDDHLSIRELVYFVTDDQHRYGWTHYNNDVETFAL